MSVPLFVELCAGTAALSLALHGGRHARPPVSRMGSKAGYASVILATLGLRPGQGAERYLWCEPDDGCRLMLIAYTDAALRREAAAVIRGWADEEPRALWTRLRDEGPVRGCPATWAGGEVDPRELAKFAYLLGSNRLIPGCWSSDGRWVNAARDGGPGTKGGTSFGGDFATHPAVLARGFDVLSSLPATVTNDARTVDPREVARWARIVSCNELISLDPLTWRNTGVGGTTFSGNPNHGFYRPIERLARGFDDTITDLPAAIVDDARAVKPAQLPPGTIAFMDPPYVGTTGYASDLPRSDVVALARRWADAGAWVVISEAEPIPDLVADGWHAVEITGGRIGAKRTFSRQQREWLTMSRAPVWRPSEQASLFS